MKRRIPENGKKAGPRILSETESFQCDIVRLQRRNLELEKEVITLRESLNAAEKRLLALKEETQEERHSKTFDKLGLGDGSFNMIKREDGRYIITLEKNSGGKP